MHAGQEVIVIWEVGAVGRGPLVRVATRPAAQPHQSPAQLV